MAKLYALCLLLGLTAALGARTTTSEARAQAWLKAHASSSGPDQDDLAELAKADPNSYAIVKALLAKQKLGMLNTHAHNQVSVSSDDSSEESSVSSMSEADSGSSSHNWLAWKPHDDSSMVSSVLGQVAQLKGAGAADDQASQSTGLLSSQSTVQSTAEQVTSADTNMDLSYGAYQAAATESTKSTFDQDAKAAQAGLGKLQGMGDALDSPIADSSQLTGSGPMGVSMNWDQEGSAEVAKKTAAAPADQSNNSYLSQYPLSALQKDDDEYVKTKAERSPAAILGAWLQKGNAGYSRPRPSQVELSRPAEVTLAANSYSKFLA